MTTVSQIRKATAEWFGQTEMQVAAYLRVMRDHGFIPQGGGGRGGVNSAIIDQKHALALIVGILAGEPAKTIENARLYGDLPFRGPALDWWMGSKGIIQEPFTPPVELLPEQRRFFESDFGNLAMALVTVYRAILFHGATINSFMPPKQLRLGTMGGLHFASLDLEAPTLSAEGLRVGRTFTYSGAAPDEVMPLARPERSMTVDFGALLFALAELLGPLASASSGGQDIGDTEPEALALPDLDKLAALGISPCDRMGAVHGNA